MQGADFQNLNGFVLPNQTFECPYIKCNRATQESIIIENIDPADLDRLLEMGYRHFGPYFFRPVCTSCHQCIPIRINSQDHVLTRNSRRLIKKNAEFGIKLTTPFPRPEFYQIFQKHKERFADTPQDTYRDYVEGFFYPFPFNHALIMTDGNHPIAFSHIDITKTAISAVYNYFDDRYAEYSPGTHLIYQILMLAKKMKLEWVYLGYYVASNRHMNYKTRFRPNQLLLTPGTNGWTTLLSTERYCPPKLFQGVSIPAAPSMPDSQRMSGRGV